MEGGQNFRDIGGYPSRSGGFVRWKRVYRSGEMSRISESDRKILGNLDIAQIYDLRANDERAESPTEWHFDSNIELWAYDHEFSAGSLLSSRLSDQHSPTDTHKLMIEVYQKLPFEQAESFSSLFKTLASGVGPLIYNCTAGKDRTGLATALLLDVLDVDRELIIEDYLLSNEHISGLLDYLNESPKYRSMMDSKFEVLLPMIRVEQSYLEASFAAIEGKFGTVSHYLENVLHMGEDQQCAIRLALLEPEL